MSGGDNRNARDSVRGILRGVLALIVILTLAGAFGSRLKPATGVSLPGIAIMLVGLALVVLAGVISERMAEEKRESVRVACKLIGLAMCVVGALMVFYM